MILSVLFTGAFFSPGALAVSADGGASSVNVQEAQDTKYDKHVMRSLRESFGISKHATHLDGQIEAMPQVDVMDAYLGSFGKKVKGKEVREAVQDVFDIDLDLISEQNYGSKLSAYAPDVMEALRVSLRLEPDDASRDDFIMDLPKSEVMDRYIGVHGYDLTGAESRILINQIFGVNLDGISKLEHAQLGISSKGQWIVRSETDLFLITSTLDDVGVYVETTDYYEQVTGTDEMPESLKDSLLSSGFVYDAATDRYFYSNPTGESVPDAFKGRTIGMLLGAIQQINHNF
ncbi:hypothetical protein [Indiicoccus explosivorum]|uniref:hypothetical protein n=1 Tax=Indiicoccus explosivorum TaxID=1917864 RepID=UPI001F4E33D4|nr:hypothetical protein [Indiicoccus explosivorum]